MASTTTTEDSASHQEAGPDLFLHQVRDALASLSDLPYLQSHPLAHLLSRRSNSEPLASGQLLQRLLLDVIERLQPDSKDQATPERMGRRYHLLRLRYVEGLDVPAVCLHLGCSRSDYYRQLGRGVQTIAASLESELTSGSGPMPFIMSVGYETPLVGREEELELLKAAYLAAASGVGGSIVMITGEQGVGKTRLAQELGRWVSLEGGLFLEGRWAAWEGAAPYGAIAESLRQSLRQLDAEKVAQLVGPYAHDLSRLFPEVVQHPEHRNDATRRSPEEQELRLYEGVGTLVYNLSQQQPLVMFLDDLHLAPQMNLQLHVARRLKKYRLLIIYAYREDELLEHANLVAGRNELIRSRVVTEVRLTPLTESETGLMISHSFGTSAAAQLQAPIYAINRGNPFFVEEVLRFLVENKAVRRVEGRWEVLDITRLGIPESVKLLVQERVARLGEDVVAMLQQASVLGEEFSFAALSFMATLPEDRLVAMIDHALAASLLVDRTLSPTDELYSFQEDHFREALYETIPATRRRRYHLQAGHALRKLYPSRLEELAYHFTHGSDAALGATYSYQAAEKSNSLFNWGRAIPLYQDALDLWEEQGGHLAERAASAENLGNACYKSGINVRHAVGYLEQALSFYMALDNHRKAATIHSQLGREHMHSGNIGVQDLTLALAHFDRAEALLGTESKDIPHGLLYCGRALAHLDRLDLGSSVSWAQQALDVGERVGSPSIIANACSPLGSVLGHSTVMQAREALERAWRVSSEENLGFQADLSRACGARVLGVVLKDPKTGIGWAERGPDYGTTYSLFDIPSHLVALFALKGEFDDASRILGDLQGLLRLSGQPVFGLWPDELGLLWIRKGEWEHAESQLTDALDWSVGSKNRLMEASVSQKLGEVCLALDRYSDSERHLIHSLDLISGSGSIVAELAVMPHLSELYRRTGRYAEANETLIQAWKAIGETTAWGALWGDLRLEEALASAAQGRCQDGEEFFQTAVQVYQEYALPWDEARAYYEWAIALVRVEKDGPHSDRARTLLTKAIALWAPMGASKYVERCRAALAVYS